MGDNPIVMIGWVRDYWAGDDLIVVKRVFRYRSRNYADVTDRLLDEFSTAVIVSPPGSPRADAVVPEVEDEERQLAQATMPREIKARTLAAYPDIVTALQIVQRNQALYLLVEEDYVQPVI